MSFAWELTIYHTSSAGWYLIYTNIHDTRAPMRWDGMKRTNETKIFVPFFRCTKSSSLTVAGATFFLLAYRENTIQKHAKARESSMIIANIHRRSYNSHVCSLQKSWLHQTGAPGSVNTTTTLPLVYIFGLWFVYVEWRYSAARQVVKKRRRERASVENAMNMYENFILMRASSQLVPHGNTHTCFACHSEAAVAKPSLVGFRSFKGYKLFIPASHFIYSLPLWTQDVALRLSLSLFHRVQRFRFFRLNFVPVNEEQMFEIQYLQKALQLTVYTHHTVSLRYCW